MRRRRAWLRYGRTSGRGADAQWGEAGLGDARRFDGRVSILACARSGDPWAGTGTVVVVGGGVVLVVVLGVVVVLVVTR